MFYLLVVLIAITLIGIVAGATSNYIGAAFNDGSAEAQASTLISGGSQIAAAKTLHDTQNPGSAATNIKTDLVNVTPAYLDQTPNAPTNSYSIPTATPSVVQVTGIGSDICTAVNEKAGTTPSSVGDGNYGCNGSTFFYSL